MDPLRCRYADCPEDHPVAEDDEQITCPTCRSDLGLPALGDAADLERAAMKAEDREDRRRDEALERGKDWR